MSLPRPTSRPADDQSPFIPLENKDSLGTGPANELIARLAAAIAQEEDFGGRFVVDRPEPRWTLAKTATVLLAGCGLFWLLSYIFIAAFF